MKKKALYCTSCKLENMVDVKHKKCIICKLKQPTYNYQNEKQRLYCKDCKTCGMVDIRHNKCITCNVKRAAFNYPIEKQTLYCNDCKHCGMVDITHKKCINCNLSSKKTYNNHCAFCFINLFPNNPISTKARCSKELKVVIHMLNILILPIIIHSMWT